MAVRRLAVMAAALGILGAVACSKTQDTAPEQRIFGSPPTIQSVTVDSQPGHISCNATQFAQDFICSLTGLTPDAYTITPGPGITADIDYAQFEFQVGVVDPESTPQKTDILLVSASYLTPPQGGQKPEEASLVLFNDGSETQFPYKQRTENCAAAQINLTSNDASKTDNIYTRGFAWVATPTVFPPPPSTIPSSSHASALIADCVARDTNRAPADANAFVGKSVDFKIEAVDREGNLTTWPQNPIVSVPPTGFACTGDPCICCFMSSSDPNQDPPVGCKGLSGFVGAPGSGFENGLCTLLPF